jgi:hypothetical protein
MLALLLDEHVSPAVAKGLVRRHPHLVVHSLRTWEAGKYLGQSDDIILQAAHRQSLTLVTFDQRTIRSLVMDWAHEERPHSGVIFVDEKTVSPGDIGGLVRALSALIAVYQNRTWKDRTLFLER